MEKITPILARKQHHFKSILSDCSLSDALNKMNCENTGYLIVVDNNENFLGLLTDHDIAGKAMQKKRSSDEILVSELMNTRLPVASSDDTVERCMKMMCQHHVQQIPVFDKYEFKGIISMDDLLEEAVMMRSEIFDEENEMVIY
jgi:predicted transcriptional regulator